MRVSEGEESGPRKHHLPSISARRSTHLDEFELAGFEATHRLLLVPEHQPHPAEEVFLGSSLWEVGRGGVGGGKGGAGSGGGRWGGVGRGGVFWAGSGGRGRASGAGGVRYSE